MLTGAAQLLNGNDSAIYEAIGYPIAVAWSLTLVIFGALGLAATLAPRDQRIMALGFELVARLALCIGSLTYAVAIIYAFGPGRGAAVSVTYAGIAGLMAAGACQITKLLVAQRRIVTQVIEQNENQDS